MRTHRIALAWLVMWTVISSTAVGAQPEVEAEPSGGRPEYQIPAIRRGLERAPRSLSAHRLLGSREIPTAQGRRLVPVARRRRPPPL